MNYGSQEFNYHKMHRLPLQYLYKCSLLNNQQHQVNCFVIILYNVFFIKNVYILRYYKQETIEG